MCNSFTLDFSVSCQDHSQQGQKKTSKGRRRKERKSLKPGEVDPADVLPKSKLAPKPIDVMAESANRSKYIITPYAP